MSSQQPLLVAEDLTPRWNLFRLFGVRWQATRYGWLSIAWWAALGCAVAFVERLNASQAGWLLAGVEYGAVLMCSNVFHSLGHVIAGRAIGSPVHTVLTTSTRDVIIYERPGTAELQRRRLGRALGGPAASLAAGCALLLVGRVAHASWVVMAGVFNVGVCLWTLMPVPSLDGWVVWHSLIGTGRSRA
jgi:hypothetical protein